MEFSSFIISLFCLAMSYLLGSLPSGYLAGKWLAKIDLRDIGSGSTGATNVLRHVGKRAALIVFLLDVSKGIASILIAKKLLLDDSLQVASGIAALAGHIWPVWLKWKGGKAVATGLGIFLGMSWQVGLAALGIFLTILSTTKIVSLSSICAASALPVLMFLSFQHDNMSNAYLVVSIIAMILVIWRHRANINRLLNGKEPRIGQKS